MLAVRKSGPPKGGWNELIGEIVAGRWRDPRDGALTRVPYESVVIAEALEGQEAELVAALKLGKRFAIVSDEATHAAMGARVARALKSLGTVSEIVLDHPHADMGAVERLKDRLAGFEAVIAVGSGTINDLCKYVTGLDGRRYAVFGTAASMNGYTSTTASITLENGLKVSLPSHGPSGVFIDLTVNAAAPPHLAASGFADCLVRSVAQVDWWMSHRLFGTYYTDLPYLLTTPDEIELNRRAADLPSGDVAAVGYLHRVLTLCGFGVSFTGVSNHGSMGEHQISHYIDCFAGERHPGTLHGQQVGAAVLTLARLQQRMLARETPPLVHPTRIDAADMARRMGPAVAEGCLLEFRKKALDADGARAFNTRLQRLWPELRRECLAFAIPVAEMLSILKASGGPTNARELGLPVDFYREAVVHCREMRNRFSFLDIAADAGELETFAEGES
jgi:glycerol-1-phosphate dehydrogenase [NAD(P)+]